MVGELVRIAHEVVEHLPQAGRVAAQHRDLARDPVADEGVALCGRARREQVDHFARHVVRLEVDALERQLAGLDLREVEHVVEHGQQRVRRVVQHRQKMALLLGEIGFLEQIAHADDARHRRAQLVAHHRQEVGLGAHRFLGLVARDAQLFLLALTFGHVAHDAREEVFTLIDHFADRQRDFHRAPVHAAGPDGARASDDAAAAGAQIAFDVPLVSVGHIARQQHGEGLADHLVRRAGEYRFGRPVELTHDAIAVDRDDAVGGRVDDRAQASFLRGDLQLGLLAFGQCARGHAREEDHAEQGEHGDRQWGPQVGMPAGVDRTLREPDLDHDRKLRCRREVRAPCAAAGQFLGEVSCFALRDEVAKDRVGGRTFEQRLVGRGEHAAVVAVDPQGLDVFGREKAQFVDQTVRSDHRHQTFSSGR